MKRALEVNWPYWQTRRNVAIEEGYQGVAYLLAPEMSRLVRDRTSIQHEFLLASMWYTGAKISEVLALESSNFDIQERGVAVSFGDGRVVPVSSKRYLSLVKRIINEPQPSKSTRSGAKNASLLKISRQTASSWLSRRIEMLKQPGQGGFVTFPVTFNTFRHSFAFNALLFGIPLDSLQLWLGHNQAEMTRRYMAYFDADNWTLIERIEFE